jgi:hypothetical protein
MSNEDHLIGAVGRICRICGIGADVTSLAQTVDGVWTGCG